MGKKVSAPSSRQGSYSSKINPTGTMVLVCFLFILSDEVRGFEPTFHSFEMLLILR